MQVGERYTWQGGDLHFGDIYLWCWPCSKNQFQWRTVCVCRVIIIKTNNHRVWRHRHCDFSMGYCERLFSPLLTIICRLVLCFLSLHWLN